MIDLVIIDLVDASFTRYFAHDGETWDWSGVPDYRRDTMKRLMGNQLNILYRGVGGMYRVREMGEFLMELRDYPGYDDIGFVVGSINSMLHDQIIDTWSKRRAAVGAFDPPRLVLGTAHGAQNVYNFLVNVCRGDGSSWGRRHNGMRYWGRDGVEVAAR